MRVATAAHRALDRANGAPDAALRTYLSDLTRPFGLALRDNGIGPSYAGLAEPLIEAVVPDGAPVDLLILAHRLHDRDLGRPTATYLSSRCPGAPLAFAVCDQGVAAPFTALGAIEAYAPRRALLLIVEQPILPYELAEPVAMPDRAVAVALRLERSAGRITVRQRTAVPPDEAGAALSALAADRGDVVVRNGVPGQPFTGVWWELSRGLSEWQTRGELVHVAEYDRSLGYLCVATLDFRLDN